MLFGSSVYNSRCTTVGRRSRPSIRRSLSFEDFSLSDGTVMILTELLDSGATREIVGGNVPRGDGQFITEAYYRERTIIARGIVKKDTAATLDAYLDTIRKSLRAREGNLDIIDNNGTAKRYIARWTTSMSCLPIVGHIT